jgi:hypothetical protein
MLVGLLAPAVVVAQQDKTTTSFPIGSLDGHEYVFVPEAKTWHDAVAYCAQDGGHLVTIDSAAEDSFVLHHRWLGLPPRYVYTDQSWLGASDEAEEGVWRWVTGEPLTYTNWGPDEPSDADASGQLPTEDYMTFHRFGAYPEMYRFYGVWNDWQYEEDGTESRLPFTCEYE